MARSLVWRARRPRSRGRGCYAVGAVAATALTSVNNDLRAASRLLRHYRILAAMSGYAEQEWRHLPAVPFLECYIISLAAPGGSFTLARIFQTRYTDMLPRNLLQEI
jgi:hypothetical protein